MSVQNRISDVKTYLQTAPVIKGLSEIHIFFSPVDPKPETVKMFVEICEKINEQRKNDDGFIKIKPCHLSLDFRGSGMVRVMQSSRYITSKDMMHVVKECYDEADLMQKMFNDAFEAKLISEKVEVIREKIEAIASAEGVPVTNEEAKKFDRYFEYHIKVKRKNLLNSQNVDPIDDDEVKELVQLSHKLSEKFGRPVPLSFVNNMFHQRFLNVRFEGVGSAEAGAYVKEVEHAISSTKNFMWDKTISEYVWFDSFRALDKGWIDFE
ncbi:hypothetical protein YASMINEVIRUS_28 [Yasminevirus sp. GU-2018]|uniref:Uncharacterized protein n=1 Tax=Yasminevirus sp. GU-2018 TaxID=2420051 RepID=A0A5K0U8W2_9VIRU|nr:hypothetical protein YASMINEVIRUS_28 [Yasminevirus sp. GU-2018]